MDPVMLQIGPVMIRWYGFLIAMGVMLGTLWAARLAVRRNLDVDALLEMAPYLVFSGLIGARLVYVITSPQAFFGLDGRFLDVIKIWEGGISIHGGILGVMIAAQVFTKIKKINMWSYLDLMTPLGALGIMGGRVGNFLNGTDTGGRLTEWGIGFVWPKIGSPNFGEFGRPFFGDTLWRYYPPACGSVIAGGDSCVVHLTPLYGFLVGLILLFVSLWALQGRKSPGFAFAQFALWYSILRSTIEEPFRDNPLFWKVYLNDQVGIGGLTLTQIVSVPIILLAIYSLLVINSNRNVQSDQIAVRDRRP